MSADVQGLLNEKVESLSVLLKGGEVATVDKSALLQDVLELLSKHDIRSVPVVDNSNGGRLLGLVDMVDIITFVVRFAEECYSLPATQRNFAWFTEQLAKSGQTIFQIAGLSQKNKLVPVMQGTTLYDIIQIMDTNSVQRVPVLSSDNKLINFVTQSSLIQYFSKHSSKFGKYGEYTLAELGFKAKKVYAVKETAIAIEAFKLMAEQKITGVPILDNDGSIITNISSKDLRNLLNDPQFFEKLQLPVERFASDLKTKTFMHNAETMYPKICCKLNSKFIDVLNKLAATKIHRIYLVDESDHPIGVISLHDMVSKVLEITKENEVPPSHTLGRAQN